MQALIAIGFTVGVLLAGAALMTVLALVPMVLMAWDGEREEKRTTGRKS